MKLSDMMVALAASASVIACTASGQSTARAAGAPLDRPVLVRADGSYPTKSLAKENIVLKVLQTTVDSLSDFPTIEAGLDHNLRHMEEIARKACTTGKKPDFLLYHEFPLTGYSGAHVPKN